MPICSDIESDDDGITEEAKRQVAEGDSHQINLNLNLNLNDVFTNIVANVSNLITQVTDLSVRQEILLRQQEMMALTALATALPGAAHNQSSAVFASTVADLRQYTAFDPQREQNLRQQVQRHDASRRHHGTTDEHGLPRNNGFTFR